VDDRTWNVLVDAAKEGHAAAMAEGFVMQPALYPLVKGRLVGYVRLRPVYQGQDAATAIGEMSNLAAAARADEVAIFWETQDIAAACEHVPLHPDPGLNALLATADTHVVHRFRTGCASFRAGPPKGYFGSSRRGSPRLRLLQKVRSNPRYRPCWTSAGDP
jgi:hypothetical protein